MPASGLQRALAIAVRQSSQRFDPGEPGVDQRVLAASRQCVQTL